MIGSRNGSRYISVTKRSLSTIRKGNFCISTGVNNVKETCNLHQNIKKYCRHRNKIEKLKYPMQQFNA